MDWTSMISYVHFGATTTYICNDSHRARQQGPVTKVTKQQT